MSKADLYRAEREKGKTYRQIAEEFGVSYQRVAEACSGAGTKNFFSYTEKRCIYPHLRRWLNDNRVGLSEFVERMGYVSCSRTNDRIRDCLRGRYYPTKKMIDKMIAVTGLTCEELFSEGLMTPKKATKTWNECFDDGAIEFDYEAED